jgi:hypothetical protein
MMFAIRVVGPKPANPTLKRDSAKARSPLAPRSDSLGLVSNDDRDCAVKVTGQDIEEELAAQRTRV